MAILEVKDVDFRYYGSNFGLSGVNLSLNNGDRLAIYGRENSGKTTLLRVLCGLESYNSGSILLDGVELKELSQKDMDIGFTFDKSILDGKSIVKDVVSMPMKLRKVPQSQVESYLADVSKRYNLPMNAQVKDLSDMQIAMLILSRLFEVERRLYLIDDVWKDLSKEEKTLVTDRLIEDIRDKSVIIATDDANFAKSIATDKVLAMTDKEVSPPMSVREICSRPINMQSAIFAGYELHIGELVKIDDKYFADIYGERFSVSRPIGDVYVGKRVCFAVKRIGDSGEREEVVDGEVMSFYYDINNERIISR